jgi:hypothetical protein
MIRDFRSIGAGSNPSGSQPAEWLTAAAAPAKLLDQATVRGRNIFELLTFTKID